MATTPRTPVRVPELIERMGLFFESEGLSRIAGRVLGLLLLSPEPRSLDEIARTLGVSKASASTETRLLERRGVLERVGRPGDRRVYYEVTTELPIRSMEMRLERMRRFHALIAEARRARVGDPRVARRLADMDAAYARALEAVDAALRAWRRRAARRPGPATR